MAGVTNDDWSKGEISSGDRSTSEPPTDDDGEHSGGEAEEVEVSVDDESATSESSNPESATEGLRGDLERALSMDFDFKGDFAFASKLEDAPNPGLQVAPLGLIGLPLSERDARSIKDIASQAPFGHGDQLVVDTNVRHTWEIEPAGTVAFANPAWGTFISSVAKRACHELGVSNHLRAPRCELYKLLLYEQGSHFQPHQDTEKAQGMFATVVIVLPSFYSGGQVCVSHGSKTKVFDFSSDGFATSMLTWFADVVHEVKPITSGYRLALSYNLIQEETSIPMPTVPSTSAAHTELKGILHNWSKGLYNTPPPLIAYVLEHKYSRVDLGSGGKSLKGKDAQLVMALRQIASEEGIELAFAELECHVVGSAGEDFDAYGGYHKRRRCYYDEYSDDWDDEPTMGEECSRTTSISSVVDFDGNQLIGKESIELNSGELVPPDPFEGENPDERDYEGYMGNYPGDVQYWYRRVVLVLYLKADSHGLLLRAGGASYAMSQLKLRNPDQPSALDRKFATHVIGHLNSPNVLRGTEREWLAYMFELALRWRDSEIWLKIASKIGSQQNLHLLGEERLNAAWDVFGFDTLRPFFQDMVAQSPNLTAQMATLDGVLRRVKTEDDRAKVSTWCEHQRGQALAHMKTPVESDVPTLITVIKSKGIHFFVETIQSQFARYQPSFKFMLAFVTALQKEKESLLGSQPAESTFKQAIQFCLILATGQWKTSEAAQYSYAYYGQPAKKQGPTASFTRIKEIIDLCFLTERADLCRTLFVSLINDKADTGVKFKDYFIPLVPVLWQTLNLRNIPLNSDPFGDFFRYMIETYLVNMLGSKSGKMRHNVIRKLGCGCRLCKDLDDFLLSVQGQRVFRYKQQDRKHLEQRLASARDLATLRTITSGSPHGLEVTKHADVLAGQTWEGRQKAARIFLGAFGGDAALKLIMGPRFPDVCKVISGEMPYSNPAKPFTSAAPAAPVSTRPDQIAQAASATGEAHLASAASAEASASPDVRAGTKRKYLGFIDLVDSP